jgi:Ca-activated chloride channel family protein
MEWQQPEWLYPILPLGIAWLALSLYSRGRRRRAAEAFVARTMWDRILPADSRARFWMKLVFREAALVAALVALAGPRFGTQYEEVIPRGSDLYVLIDVSRSMLAEDVPPSRLGRAKADVAALVNRLEGERIGLIAFAGQAVVKCPLTVDYDAFRRSLDDLDPDSAPRGGTAIGDAIRKALEVFQPGANRDQAILLITDGDDQQSYPLEAAAVAAERHVTVFAVGLGDADQGARIPKGQQTKSYLEYQGSQVWSKLNGSLLKEIALKTSGVYVPAGTRSYDLGDLYTKYLQGRRGGDEQTHKRIRRAEQFQVFLSLALLALLADAFTRLYQPAPKASEHAVTLTRAARTERRAAVPVANAVFVLAMLGGFSRADSPAESVRDGLRWYEKGDFDKAKEKFDAAREGFTRGDATKAAIAAFDEGCAVHRKGDAASAREWYLKAGLARDKPLAASAHFNLGTLASEEARRLAGDHPENIAPEKRQEIVDQLKGAVASFRHSLELQPDNSRARRDIELVRQWIKYYSDKWQSLDREKRRKETNLIAFLEYLIETQRTLRESVKATTSTTPANAFAELKRLQDELREEIGPLKEKIEAELRPQQAAGGPAAPGQSQEVERGIALLQGWADTAGEKMISAAQRLDGKQADSAANDQLQAIAELEKIWDAVIPFHPLLARELADQTGIVQSLAPATTSEANPENEKPPGSRSPQSPPSAPASKGPSAQSGVTTLGTQGEELAQVGELQERTLGRAQLLKLKAQAELERLEKEPAPAPTNPVAKDNTDDPKQVKAGYQKAIELAPRAVEQMDKAVKSLKRKNRQAALAPAEEARKILEQIQKAQPKNNQKDQKSQDQNKKNEEQKKNDDQKKNEEQKKNDEQKKRQDQQKNDQQKKDQEQKKQNASNKSGSEKQEPKQRQPQISRDQVEEALRKVRERQQEKRERDRQMKVRVMGRVPVEKDW